MSVTLAVPIVLNVPDMWVRVEDNLLPQTIVPTIPLNDYNPAGLFLASGSRRDSGLSKQCRERYMPAAFVCYSRVAYTVKDRKTEMKGQGG